MITSNALGHFEYYRNGEGTLGEKEKTHALDNAMRTINNAYGNDKKKEGAWLIVQPHGSSRLLRASSHLSGNLRTSISTLPLTTRVSFIQIT